MINNKKITALKEKKERHIKELDAATHPNIISYHKLQITLLEYDINDAIKSESKRVIRKNVKRLSKLMAEAESLRADTIRMLNNEDVLTYYIDRMQLTDELSKKYDLDSLLYGNN